MRPTPKLRRTRTCVCYSEGRRQVNYPQQPKNRPVGGEGPPRGHRGEGLGHYRGAGFLIHCTPVCVFECGNEEHAYGEDAGTSAIAITHMLNANVWCTSNVVYPQHVEYLDHHQRHLIFPSYPVLLPLICVCRLGVNVRG